MCQLKRINIPRGSAAILAIGATVAVMAGCSPLSWQRVQESPVNPAVWMRSLFPPEGESFYNDQSHEIERSLGRHRPGGASPVTLD